MIRGIVNAKYRAVQAHVAGKVVTCAAEMRRRLPEPAVHLFDRSFDYLTKHPPFNAIWRNQPVSSVNHRPPVGMAPDRVHESVDQPTLPWADFASDDFVNIRALAKKYCEDVDPQALDYGTHKCPQFPGYTFVHALPTGATAKTWRMRRDSDGKEFAFKVLNPNFVKDQTIVEFFLQEARNHYFLRDHDNVVHFEGLLLEPLTIVTEYNPLQDILEKLFRDGKTCLDVSEAIPLFCDWARALAYAHEHDIVHCDLKPENLYVRPDGVGQISDFGNVLDKNDVSTGVRRGTPGFCAPEQLVLGDLFIDPQTDRPAEIDCHTDVFSLGAVMYDLLTGVVPFGLERLLRLRDADYYDVSFCFKIFQQMNNPAYRRAPSHYNPEIPKALDEIIMKCLSVNPGDRYPSAAEVLAALEALL